MKNSAVVTSCDFINAWSCVFGDGESLPYGYKGESRKEASEKHFKEVEERSNLCVGFGFGFFRIQ